jgi:hypothetical protein
MVKGMHGSILPGCMCPWTPQQPDQFKPDYNTEAVLVEEMQRMGAEIAALHTEIDTLHKILVTRAEQIVGLQDGIRNLTGEE